MSDRVVDQTIAELQAVLRGLELAAGGSVEQHDRWTRTAAMMLGTAVDALVYERDRADDAENDRGIDAAHLAHQREWSRRTFGPGARTAGVLDHITKEIEEVRAAPDDVTEWADLLILAFDGAWRAGHEPQAVIDAIKAKQARNESREWPDWRNSDPDKAIEHVRG